VITDVVQAWDGIATIRAELTAEGSDRQWRRAGQVVEEGVANAIRSGGARSIMIEVASDGDALVGRIVDDGTGLADGHTQGLGTLWLDQVVPGAWLRSSGAQGTELVVRIS
jgi:anti-sigma regulatory factor (Ser/Thr protein kinase)